jgi:hypothetical protein
MRKSLITALLALLAAAASAGAQGIRVNGVTTARYIELRPLNTLEKVGMVPLTQDLTVNVWGLGTGVRLYGEFRGRVAAGEQTGIWPQADDPFDVLAAYAEINRAKFRARAGRQWKTSSLGFYNFDGASLLLRPGRILSAEVYGGWSLLQGESDQIADAAIAGIEPYAPDEKRNLIGGEIKLRFGPRVSVTTLYQREVTTDRSAIHSERVAADATVRAGRLTIDGGVESDLANEVINEARVRLLMPIGSHFSTTLEARRYRPYFDLWTIWGAFNPIGFSEALATASWQAPGNQVSLRLGGGMRRYGSDQGGVEWERLRDDGWRVLADASITPTRLLTFTGGYRADIGFGASRSQGDINAQLNITEGSYVGFNVAAFQMINELQISDGTVYGFGTNAAFKLPHDTRIGWNFAVYRHDQVKPATTTDWNQLRGTVFVEWTIGTNPDQPRVARAK